MVRNTRLSSMRRYGWFMALMGGLLMPVQAQDVDVVPTETAPNMHVQSVVAGRTAGMGRVFDAGCPIVPVTINGDWARINAGQASPWDFTQVDTKGMVAALGIGAVGKYNTAGDMLSFAGRTFIRATNPKTGVKLVEVQQPFRSPFLVGIPRLQEGITPRAYRLRGERSYLLQSVLETLANDAQSPIGVLGWVNMPELKAMALKKAPIDDMPLFGNRMDECLSTIEMNNASVVFFAVVSPASTPRPSLNAYLIAKRALGQDARKSAPVAAQINVMGASIAEPVPADYFTRPLVVDDLKTTTVKDIFRVLGHSSVQKGTLFVYRLDYLYK